MGVIAGLRELRPWRGGPQRVGVVLPVDRADQVHHLLGRVQEAEVALRTHVHRAVEVRVRDDDADVRAVLDRNVHSGALVGLTWGCLAAAGAVGTQDAPLAPLDGDFWSLVLLVLASCGFWVVVGALGGGLFRRRSVVSSGLAGLADSLPSGQHAVLLSVPQGEAAGLVEAVAPDHGRVAAIEPTATGPDSVVGRHPRLAWWSAWTAAVLAFAYAGVSLYWGASGDLGLDTVGGGVERLATESPALAQALAFGAGLLKLLGGALALALVQHWGEVLPRGPVHVLAALAGLALVAYGGLYVGAGALVLLGVLDLPDADRAVLAWHVGLWDLWFLLWGVALLVAVWATRLPAASSAAASGAPTGSSPRPR